MLKYKYLSREHLEGFDNYKYMAIDTSPLSVNVMHPFWNKIVNYVPLWVAPNVLTFVGFLLTVLDFVILSVYDYGFYLASSPVTNLNGTEKLILENGQTSVMPHYAWILIAVFLFVAYTLDGIDGKQARRTQTSGPLGELFDHGLDSYSVFFIPVCLYSVFGRADFSLPPIRMYFIVWSILFNFYLSHWEKYNTGVLFLPWGYDVSMWSSTFIFMLTGLMGTTFYKTYVYGSYTVANVFEWVIYATGLVTNLPVSLYNLHKSYKLRTGKMRSFMECMRPLWSLFAVFGVTTLWVLKSPNNVVDYDPRVVYLLLGTLFSNIACRLIVSQMSNQRCEAIPWIQWPLTFATGLSIFCPQYEITTLYVFTAMVILAHVHYGTCVVQQMCEHFRVQCFQIKKRLD